MMHARKRFPTVSRRLVDADTLRELSSRNAARWLSAIAFEWLLILATFAVCVLAQQWWVWLPAIVVIGTRQHALSILGHEGSHQLISRSHRTNDLFANWCALYALLITVQGYRSSHLKHHWYLETRDDPSKVTVGQHPRDWTFPMTRIHLLGMFLRDLSGFSQASSTALLAYLWRFPNRVPHMLGIAFVQLVIFAALTMASGSYLAYPILWIVPLLTVSVACYRVRAIAEHSAFGDSSERYRRTSVDSLLNTRTTLMCPVLAAIFAPYNISYHIEHHMYPSVPCFNLAKLYKQIRNHPEYVRHAHVTRGYRGLFSEFTMPPQTI